MLFSFFVYSFLQMKYCLLLGLQRRSQGFWLVLPVVTMHLDSICSWLTSSQAKFQFTEPVHLSPQNVFSLQICLFGHWDVVIINTELQICL